MDDCPERFEHPRDESGPAPGDSPEVTIRSYRTHERELVGMAGVPMRNLAHYTTALMRRRYDLSRGIAVMLMGYTAFMLGLVVLSTSTSSDPHWFVMLVTVLTWLSCFVVMAGFTYISTGILARKLVSR
jgi:hypothetical protein